MDAPEASLPDFSACTKFFNCTELVHHMLSSCDLPDVQQFGATSRWNSQLVRGYLQWRLATVGGQYFTEGKTLVDLLHTCDAVVSGSTALHVLLPVYGTAWAPGDLDIYVAPPTSQCLLQKLLFEGYTTVKDVDLNEKGYTYFKIARLFVLTKGHRHIDVIVSSTSCAISPILQFHSMAVMNFISADTIFCCYPTLTLRHLSMMNAAFLYFGASTGTVMEAVTKYQGRGFRFVKYGEMMWINMHGIPEASHSCVDVFRQFGVLDVQWTLGGIPCGLECAFCRPRVEVVEEESNLLMGTMFGEIDDLFI
ncbi:hypothetical protein EDD15DRAFT_2368509 [Pisolithus albus]|nr:hypothetical protein EDD15DRAFT_2368509 [Pisolithus albus]